ncbi:IS1595 family transposase, partial [Rhodovibrio sodomensis]
MANDHLTLQGFLDLVPDEDHAEALFLSARWPDGPVCRWCGAVGNARQLPGHKMLFHCRDCGRATSARAGTPMEASHLPVRTWLTAMFLMACSSKGIRRPCGRLAGCPARQLGFWLGLQYRTAWHLSHRIRRMDSPSAPRRGAMEADDPVLRGVVEMDETYVGGAPRPRNTGDDDSDDDDCGDGPVESRPKGRGTSKPLLLTAVERGGSVHAHRIESHRTDAIAPAWRAWVDPMARLVTDALPAYRRIGQSYPSHLTVNHS